MPSISAHPKVIALIGEVQDDNEIHIVGLGQAPSRGLKAGMVTNIDATAQAIQQAVNEAELMADTKISHVTTGIAGNHIRSLNSQGVVKLRTGKFRKPISTAPLKPPKPSISRPDHNILHTVVQEYIIDNQPGVKEPIGMSGVRLDTRDISLPVPIPPCKTSKMYPSLRFANGSNHASAFGERSGCFD